MKTFHFTHSKAFLWHFQMYEICTNRKLIALFDYRVNLGISIMKTCHYIIQIVPILFDKSCPTNEHIDFYFVTLVVPPFFGIYGLPDAEWNIVSAPQSISQLFTIIIRGKKLWVAKSEYELNWYPVCVDFQSTICCRMDFIEINSRSASFMATINWLQSIT